jgi:hypothetical protein
LLASGVAVDASSRANNGRIVSRTIVTSASGRCVDGHYCRASPRRMHRADGKDFYGAKFAPWQGGIQRRWHGYHFRRLPQASASRIMLVQGFGRLARAARRE